MLAAAGCGGGGTDTGATTGYTQDPAVTAAACARVTTINGQLQQTQTPLLNNGGNFGDAAVGNGTTAQITASLAPLNRITVTVELDAKPEQITFVDLTSGPAYTKVADLGKSIPISTTVDLSPGAFLLTLSASGFNGSTQPAGVTCRISVDGKVLVNQQGPGNGGSASCTASSYS